MSKLWKIGIALLVLSVLIGCRPYCLGLKLNLTESCVSPRTHCVLRNISASNDYPLVVVDGVQTQLIELIIRNSEIGHVPRDILQRVPNLSSLVMYNVGLNQLHSHDFDNCPKLLKFILIYNGLSNIPEKLFPSLLVLEELYLARNSINMLHRLAFDGLSRLRYLDLQHNFIQQLSENLFAPLTHLEHIDLSSNEIEKIDSSTFEANQHLKTVLLGNNKFKVFEPNSLEHLPHLHLVDLSNSVVEELNLQSVDTLLVQNSALKSFNVSGSVLKIHGSNNQLTALKVAEKLSVRDLELQGNLFESLDDFIGMLNLQHLDLSKNRLTSLSGTSSSLLFPLPALKHLNLAFNRIENLTMENILLLNRITHLDLGFNHFSTLDANIFRPLRVLERFYIDGNHLHTFDYKSFFEGHPLLKVIGLDANPWDAHDSRQMSHYVNAHSVQLANRFPAKGVHENHFPLTNADHNFPSLMTASTPREHAFQDFENGDPSWTTKDTWALITLVAIIFIALLMIIARTLRREQGFQQCCRARALNFSQRHRSERLDEEVSEV